jgi:hypothetical protein
MFLTIAFGDERQCGCLQRPAADRGVLFPGGAAVVRAHDRGLEAVAMVGVVVVDQKEVSITAVHFRALASGFCLPTETAIATAAYSPGRGAALQALQELRFRGSGRFPRTRRPSYRFAGRSCH